jgi:hypothetical protein
MQFCKAIGVDARKLAPVRAPLGLVVLYAVGIGTPQSGVANNPTVKLSATNRSVN